MKIADLWSRQHEQTEKLSQIARRLAFAAAAICWFFKSPDVTFPPAILLSLLFLVAFFTSETLQYLLASVLLRRFITAKERELNRQGIGLEDYDIEGVPRGLITKPYVFFFAKIACLFCAFAALGFEFVSRMF
jgi:hypothetical protein